MSEYPIDGLLEAAGFAVVKDGLNSRRYEGTLGGRRLQVAYARKYYKGQQMGRGTYTSSSLHIYVDVPEVKTRAQIGPYARAFSQMKKAAVDDPLYDDRVVMGLSPDWARSLATGSDTRRPIETLINAYGEAGKQVAILVQPGSLQVIGEMHDQYITADRLQTILDAAAALGAGAEALPADYSPVEATADEQRVAEGKISRRALWIGAGIFVGLGAFGACCVLSMVALGLLTQ